MTRVSPSAEQLAIIEDNSPVLAVKARAGTGKTTTLELYAEARPEMSMLYICFNKANELEAKKRFPRNVKCRTMHSIAYGAVGREYAHKSAFKLAAFQVHRVFNCHLVQAQSAITTVLNYCTSPDRDISGKHLPDKMLPLDVHPTLALAKKIWAAMCDKENPAIPMLPDGYLKLFQLGKASLGRYSRILLDEYQDTNPVTLDIYLRQPCPKIIVGDEYQGIYSFRNAINAMDAITPDKVLYLTQSFRFAAGIATLATGLLSSFFDEKIGVTGRGTAATEFTVDKKLPHAVLCRTNAGVFDAAVAYLDRRATYFIGGVENYQFQNVLDAWNLFTRNFDLIKNPVISNFDSYNEMCEYATSVEDKELISLTKVVATYGSAIPMLVDRIKSEALPTADGALVQICTAHRSKGLEFDQVVLGEDFGSFFDAQTGALMRPANIKEKEEIHLMYVAVTRAKRALQLNKTLLEWLEIYANPGEPHPLLASAALSAPTDTPQQAPETPTALPAAAGGFTRDVDADIEVFAVLGLGNNPDLQDWLVIEATRRKLGVADLVHALLQERIAG